MPTDGLSYDPTEEKYWDEDALDKEVERVFEVCHGCRMCFKYCDSFPILFSAIDDEHDGQVHKLTPLDTQRVMDACFQCKLCERAFSRSDHLALHMKRHMEMIL